MSQPTFVLIHGSSSNSLAWAPMQRELALLGQRSLAVDLPGHGFVSPRSVAYQAPQDLSALATESSAMADLRFSDSVESVIDVVRRVVEHGPVVLVGHSRGGLTVTAVGNAVPDLISRVVYISAWCCVERTVEGYLQTPEYTRNELDAITGLLVGDPAELGFLRLNWRTADPETLAGLRSAMLADGTEQELLAFVNTLDPDESLDPGSAHDRAHAETWGRIPRTYVRFTDDRSLPVELQDLFIAEADALTPDNPFDVRSVPGSHVGFLIRPAAVAGLLADLPAEP